VFKIENSVTTDASGNMYTQPTTVCLKN